MIEIRHLYTLQTLYQTDSVSAAADKLYLSQSALSHQLKELEQRIGEPLFIRKTKPIQFTREGLLLLELAQKILPEVETTQHKLKSKQSLPPSQINLALECHSCYLWLLPVIKQFNQSWPNISLELMTEHPFDPLQALTAQQLDWVLSADPLPSTHIQYTPLFHYETVLVCRPDHPLATRSATSVQAPDLLNYELITYPVAEQRLDLFREFLLPAGITPSQIRSTRHPLMMLQQVSQSDAIAALPRWVIEELGRAMALTALTIGDGLWCTMYLACEKQIPQWTTDFIHLTRQITTTYPGIRPV
ncbi:LysR substrate-binding domain-containing protein [Celerinatantimonas sp. YJH-8]|uniref:LysR substrate-binding domain-containing protein n=1 Tax=Celerinatantimonas sp. YJH-8 TaxID=3228714 RepID=UPI0038CA7EB6